MLQYAVGAGTFHSYRYSFANSLAKLRIALSSLHKGVPAAAFTRQAHGTFPMRKATSLITKGSAAFITTSTTRLCSLVTILKLTLPPIISSATIMRMNRGYYWQRTSLENMQRRLCSQDAALPKLLPACPKSPVPNFIRLRRIGGRPTTTLTTRRCRLRSVRTRGRSGATRGRRTLRSAAITTRSTKATSDSGANGRATCCLQRPPNSCARPVATTSALPKSPTTSLATLDLFRNLTLRMRRRSRRRARDLRRRCSKPMLQSPFRREWRDTKDISQCAPRMIEASPDPSV
eukprot:TRINITY_DN4125_c0_g2_i15.p1 TRINITY_DN4125_c0_g2~~TRINITY_DN4125_c0_g2_i15.p1  ORF type:complete len:290 (+),score=-52.07 TRINITY_DN4125_c0_g2_i15:120-989(+)